MWIPPPVAKEKYATALDIWFLIPNTPEVAGNSESNSLYDGGVRYANPLPFGCARPSLQHTTGKLP